MRYEANINLIRDNRRDLLQDVEAIGELLERRRVERSTPATARSAIAAAQRIVTHGGAS
jgi:hypothetical protein